LVFITVVESVYSAVRSDSLYKADFVSHLKVFLFFGLPRQAEVAKGFPIV